MKKEFAKISLAIVIVLACNASAKAQTWDLLGNGGTNPSTDFVGTTDYTNLHFRVNNEPAGVLSLEEGNTAFGHYTLGWTLGGNTGIWNTAIGSQAQASNISGRENVAVGRNSLEANQFGGYNVAVGVYALQNCKSNGIVGIGYASLQWNTGGDNVGVGFYALKENTTANSNTAVGAQSLQLNTVGEQNTALGANSLRLNTSGGSNSASGFNALTSNTTGSNNTAMGWRSLISNITGNCNTALGSAADVSGPALSNATAIGCGAIVNASNKIRLGNTNVTIVEGNAIYSVCDGRFKTNISESEVKGLEFIKRLRPVVYNFDSKKFDEFLMKNMPDSSREKRMSCNNYETTTSARQTGFIAQEVEKAMSEVGYDFSGLHKPVDENDNYSLALGQFVAPIVKAMQEQQSMIDDLRKENDDMLNKVSKLEKLLETLVAGNQRTGATESNMQLSQNIPNPFSTETAITYSLTESGVVSLQLFNDHGGKILDIENSHKEIGSYTAKLDGRNLKTGVYYYILKLNGKQLLKKAIKI